MSIRLDKIESHIQPFNDVLNALGNFNKGKIIGICGAPGIGKTVFSRFLAYVFSYDNHVMYTSFQKTQLELEQLLYLKNQAELSAEAETLVNEKYINEDNRHSRLHHTYQLNKFIGDFWETKALNSFYECSIDLSKGQPCGSLQIGDVKYSKYGSDLLLQIEKMLAMAAHNKGFDIVIIDDIDLYPAKVQEFKDWDYVQFFQGLKSVERRYNVLIIIVSNIRFSRVESSFINSGNLSYVEGGSSFTEACHKVIFIDRPSYYELTNENRDDDNDIFDVYLMKDKNEIGQESPSVIKHSKDFKYLKHLPSGFALL